jgi:hypothetical protein
MWFTFAIRNSLTALFLTFEQTEWLSFLAAIEREEFDRV